ncbi:hypothetical protein TrVE_jg1846 [Triparma verrucosa]|uniref:Peptidylprolyl isomerase n=1 Tax=Triparma verrucosa TaxID=1606542 RepID=A0A9W7CFA2_9STRA|nr:hypothetical protein TrVE_jg1846 [Triparma verrucosa]
MQLPAPSSFSLTFPTQYGPFTATLFRDLAPSWVDRVYNLAFNGYYDSNYFHRVINTSSLSIIQFGTNGSPSISQTYNFQSSSLSPCSIIDPQPPSMSYQKNLSNTFGTLSMSTSYNSLTSTTWNVTAELFINTGNNSKLDGKLFIPIGVIDLLDGLIIKYNKGHGQPLHVDASYVTVNILLNERDDFEGGGTFFDGVGERVEGERGEGVGHFSGERHAGGEVKEGVRWVLVMFFTDERTEERLERKRKGMELKNEGRIEESMEVLREVEEAECQNILGRMLAERGEWEEAVERGRRGVDLGRNDSRAWNNLGLTYKEMGRGEEAVKCFRRAVELHSNTRRCGVKGGRDSGRSRFNLGLELSLRDEFAESAEVLEGIFKEEKEEDVEERIWREAGELMEWCRRQC